MDANDRSVTQDMNIFNFDATIESISFEEKTPNQDESEANESHFLCELLKLPMILLS